MSLIVLEGLDGSGKGTQASLLFSAWQQTGCACRRISFPDYESPACEPVKMYLRGEFGKDVDSVNAYAASTFYAVDRFASFKKEWGQAYQAGEWILADRYTTSNMIYQLTKLPRDQWDEFLNWLADLEYEKMQLPKPDGVYYLDMPVEVSQKLLLQRYAGDEKKKDIHEADVAFLHHCRESALYAAARFGWRVIPCANEGEPLARAVIAGAVRKAMEQDALWPHTAKR
ncbi:MAG TPA: thymidylate kinase [Firmicutes bacterium]|nr:thymidylate kinase [Bacillota bacterium]